MKSEEKITPENLAILINTANKFMEEHNDNIKKINVIRDRRNAKHLKAISALDKRVAKYLKAIRQEQLKIDKFKKISQNLGIPLPDIQKSPDVFKETVSVVNENTGESVQLSEAELADLKALVGD